MRIVVQADATVGEIGVLKRELNKYHVWLPGINGRWDDVTHIFDEPAQDMLKNSKWKPATANGVPVAVRVDMPLKFNLTN